jgi:peptidoglycan/LPS O-acetylase OafA/YrhL
MLPNPRPVNYPEIPALTGIRFFAATFVMLAHGSAVLFRFGEHQSAICSWLIGLVYIGMSTFFVLSGFVIHYNYFDSIRTKGSHGLGKFFLTRFARLYPLFLLMIATDLWWGFSGNGKITDNGQWQCLQALPYYVPMVQSWFYKVIGQNNLIYQIANNTPVTWSISTEWFFYCAYPFFVLFLVRLKRPTATLAVTISYAVGAFYLIYISISTWPFLNAWGIACFGPIADVAKFQDSFIRWVFYFSPYMRITEFFLGCLACHCFLKLRTVQISRWERVCGQTLQAFAIFIAFLLYWCLSVHKPALIGPPLNLVFGLAPPMAIIIFCCARYQTPITRFLGLPILVLGGEISYGIYLTHILVFFELTRFVSNNPSTDSYGALWIVFVIGIIFTFIWSIFVYSFYEKPIRSMIRQATYVKLKDFRFYLRLLMPFVVLLLVLHWILVITLNTQLAEHILQSANCFLQAIPRI